MDSLFKRILFQSTHATAIARLGTAIVRRVRMRVHDEEFRGLGSLNLANPLILDVGANTGQSIIAIKAVCPGARITSLEPNPQCRLSLKLIAASFGKRVTILEKGAGNSEGSMRFFVPSRAGRQLLEEGTFDPSTLLEDSTRSRIGVEGVDYAMSYIDCPVILLDSLGLDPAFVKMDVQGFELPALQGMEQTIRRASPVIMIENGTNTADCTAYLATFGYRPCYWHDGWTDNGRGRLNSYFFKEEKHPSVLAS